MWLYAGHVSELPDPGSYFLRSLDDESVIVVRDRTGEIRAFFNVCRHRGSRLCTEPSGAFAGGIQCPYHAWTYSLDGSLKGAPNMQEVERFNRADYPLHPVSLTVWEGFIFISFSSAPAPFEELIAPLVGRIDVWSLPELESVHQTVYDVSANWKLFFQNYSECYHCPSVHPMLNKLTPYRDSFNDLDEGKILGGPMKMSIHGGSMTMNGQACAAPLGEVGGDDLGRVYYYTIFPNMFLSLHPDYVLVHRSESISVNRTRIHCDWLFHPDAIVEPDFDPSGAVEFWDMTNRQDWHLCSISQQGISSRAYTPGPYAELESQLAAFDREYLRILGKSESASRER
jgi:Rieske 2Fe-2S family protein